MKQWKLATFRLACGAFPDCQILDGEPYLELSGVSGWRKVRCGRHAGCAIPEVIDEPQPVQQPRLTVPAFTALQSLTTQFDARRKQANDDTR